MTEQLDNQGLFRKGIRYQGVARGPRTPEAVCVETAQARSKAHRDMVLDAIAKQRTDVAIPKYNLLTVTLIITACEAVIGLGFYIWHMIARGGR